ncbi:hypothetical protein L5M43_10235 [Shewanella sp. SW36]|nr:MULTISPECIES: hypothetical protein [unclassified Shewanella]MCU7975641.1 hypothetical protein [Shewanella sp. SW36]MCU7991030.1 hypothetical protein [Shewanella sp. SW1]MCU8018340.1 hypothetical protein [Shewanella sp. SM72]MCU8051590.1 hypothetical protein [Shewanella sp. SM43]
MKALPSAPFEYCMIGTQHLHWHTRVVNKHADVSFSRISFHRNSAVQ